MKSDPTRYSVHFDKISQLLPDPDENLACYSFNADLVPYLVGWLGFLRAAYPYADHRDENQDRVMRFIERLRTCNVITNLRILNGRLEAQYCGSTSWVLVGKVMAGGIRYQNGQIQYDFDGDGTFEVNQYVNNIQNTYGQGLPMVDDKDRLCRAAWALANAISDDFADIVRFGNVSTALLSGVIQSLLELLPPTALADNTIEFLIETLPITTIEWVASNARDPETIKQVAEWIYCSLKENYPDNPGNVLSDINLGIYEPLTEINPIEGVLRWTNFGALADSIYNTLTGKGVAYLIVGAARSQIAQLSQVVGVYEPEELVIRGAMATAEYFDSRECQDFPCEEWSAVFDFEDAAYLNYVKTSPEGPEAFPSYGNGFGWQTVDFAQGGIAYRMLLFNLDAGQDYDLTELEAVVYHEGLANPVTFSGSITQPPNWGAGLILVGDNNTIPSGTGTNSYNYAGGTQQLRYLRFIVYIGQEAERVGFVVIKKITIKGQGVNPFVGVPSLP